MDITRQEARDILGIDQLYAMVNAYRARPTKEQIRKEQREVLRIKDLKRAEELGLIKQPVFKNGIVYKGERITGDTKGKNTAVLLKTR